MQTLPDTAQAIARRVVLRASAMPEVQQSDPDCAGPYERPLSEAADARRFAPRTRINSVTILSVSSLTTLPFTSENGAWRVRHSGIRSYPPVGTSSRPTSPRPGEAVAAAVEAKGPRSRVLAVQSFCRSGPSTRRWPVGARLRSASVPRLDPLIDCRVRRCAGNGPPHASSLTVSHLY